MSQKLRKTPGLVSHRIKMKCVFNNPISQSVSIAKIEAEAR